MNIGTTSPSVTTLATATDAVGIPVDAPTNNYDVATLTPDEETTNDPTLPARKVRTNLIAAILTTSITPATTLATAVTERQRQYTNSTILQAHCAIDTIFLGRSLSALATAIYHDVPGSPFDNILMAAREEVYFPVHLHPIYDA